MKETPTDSGITKLYADFPTLSRALDYAAQGDSGINFYKRGRLQVSLPYAELRERAVDLAKKLSGLNLERGARIALLADTDPDFHIFFFACQYAGLVPVPIPVQFRMGSKEENINHTRWLISISRASLAMAPKSCTELLTASTRDLDLGLVGDADLFHKLPDFGDMELTPLKAEELAYLQFTSGSTQAPREVQISQRALLNNLQGITKQGLQIGQQDRSVSWLPFYHDMGLVGFVLGPVTSQTSVDYLNPSEFVMRPQLWLSLLSRNRATISFAPPFGYELCTKRLKRQNNLDYQLENWKIAGVGADMIQAPALLEFADLLQPCGFSRDAFLACYGLAEASLAVSFSQKGQGLKVENCKKKLLSESGVALPAENDSAEETVQFVKCGKLLAGLEVQVCDESGQKLDKRRCGTLYVKGSCIMQGYVDQPGETKNALSDQGWLDTGDLAYISEDEEIVIVGRNKDMLLINGKNIWPQDLESIAIRNSEVNTADALAFSLQDTNGRDTAVVLLQTKEKEQTNSEEIVRQIKSDVYSQLGINCYVELVPLHTLPRTSSGKPSRSKAKKQFLQNMNFADPESVHKSNFNWEEKAAYNQLN